MHRMAAPAACIAASALCTLLTAQGLEAAARAAISWLWADSSWRCVDAASSTQSESQSVGVLGGAVKEEEQEEEVDELRGTTGSE